MLTAISYHYILKVSKKGCKNKNISLLFIWIKSRYQEETEVALENKRLALMLLFHGNLCLISQMKMIIYGVL